MLGPSLCMKKKWEYLPPGNTIWIVAKTQKTSHTREPRGQSFPSRWPQGCKEQIRQYNRQTRNTNNKKDPQKMHRLGTASKKINAGPKHVWRYHPYFWCGSRQIDVWFAWKIPNLSMYHLIVSSNRAYNSRYINEIKKNKDSTVHTTAYWCNRNPTVKSLWAQSQTSYF